MSAILLFALFFAVSMIDLYIKVTREPANLPHRCDGDLVQAEIKGHRVEMIRWLK